RSRGDERRRRAHPPELGLATAAGRDLTERAWHAAGAGPWLRALRRGRATARRRPPKARPDAAPDLGLELDLPDHLRGCARCDHARREVARDDRVRPDDRALPD